MSAPLKAPSPSYRIDFVDRESVLPVFTYDRDLEAFTATEHASGRVSIAESGGNLVFTVAGTVAMVVTAAGRVKAKEFIYRKKPTRTLKRIEFIRLASSVKEVLGSLSATGQLSVRQCVQGAPPATTDQMVFMDGLASIGPKGLVAESFEEDDTLP